MALILTGQTPDPVQVWSIALPSGGTLTVTATYRAQQLGWYLDMSWDGQTPPWVCTGVRLVSSPNLLRQYRNLLGFGLGCVMVDGSDPSSQTSFVDGTCTLILLDAADVAAFEVAFYPGNT